jgi:hypothetical protein
MVILQKVDDQIKEPTDDLTYPPRVGSGFPGAVLSVVRLGRSVTRLGGESGNFSPSLQSSTYFSKCVQAAVM